MTHTSLLTLAAAVLVAPISGALAQDRPPTPQELVQLEQVLRAEGFIAWDYIELDDGVWEVDDAIGPDKREYDLKLNQQFQIIERKTEGRAYPPLKQRVATMAAGSTARS